MKLRWSDVTPKAQYLNRRAFIAAGAVTMAAPAWALTGKPSAFSTVQKPNTLEEITNYNNFYEFGTGKGDPAANAGKLQVEPWTVMVDGEVSKPGRYSIEDLVKPHAFEERIYRLRCVEAWSMVIPWLGFPLADLLKQVEPTSSARYVRFETLVDRERMPGQRSGFSLIDWPYVEGLRLDEAMHPLAFMAEIGRAHV